MDLSVFENSNDATIIVTLPCDTTAKIAGTWSKNTSEQRVFTGKIVGDVVGSDIYWDGDNVQFTVTAPEQNAGVLVYT